MESEEIFVWEQEEFAYRKKKGEWYWSILILGVALVFVAIIFKNILLAVLLSAATFATLLSGTQKPKVKEYAVSPKGIRVENTLYPYENLRSFWIRNEHNEKELVLETVKTFMPHLLIPLGDIDEEALADYLLSFLHKIPHEKGFLEKVADLIFL